MTLSDRLNKLRKELCHGPCGQSNSVLQQREDRDRLLKEAIRAAKAWEAIQEKKFEIMSLSGGQYRAAEGVNLYEIANDPVTAVLLADKECQ
jgi:hypothetical protein